MKKTKSMPYKVIYLDVARLNAEEAKAWYKKQQNGLQKRFVTSIKEAIARLQNNPEAYSVRYRNIRIVHPYKFPFSIHFYIDKAAKQIVITNIIHNYRDIEF